MLDDLQRHRYAIKRLFSVVNYTASIVNSKLGTGIETLKDIYVESNFRADDIKVSIKLYEEARELLLNDTEKFVEAIAIQQSYVDDIREAASSVPDKAIGISDWLNHEISPKLAEARRYVEERNCSTRLNDRIPAQNLVNRLIRIESASCCRANNRSNAGEQVGTPL